MSAPRANAGDAVAGLFSRPSATGGLARGRVDTEPAHASAPALRSAAADGTGARVRLGVELGEAEVAYLRGLSRPSRTGEPRTLGAKFVAQGILAAAIELLEHAHVEMTGVRAGDEREMAARARAALLRAVHDQENANP
jgi:hypothetical protein